MRKWHFLLGLSAVGALAGFVACGGSSDNPPATGNDAGTTKDAAADTSIGIVDAAPDTNTTPDANVGCIDAGDLNDFDAGDAALGDAGASVGLCLSCAKTNCPTQVAACNTDCYCPSDIEGFYGCISAGGSLISCGTDLYTNADTAEQNLGTCVITACADPCNAHIPTNDAGTDASTDAAADAPHD